MAGVEIPSLLAKTEKEEILKSRHAQYFSSCGNDKYEHEQGWTFRTQIFLIHKTPSPGRIFMIMNEAEIPPSLPTDCMNEGEIRLITASVNLSHVKELPFYRFGLCKQGTSISEEGMRKLKP